MSLFASDKKKYLYRATHRGTKEADHVIGQFVKAHLLELSSAEEQELEDLLNLPDQDIINFILRDQPPEGKDFPLLKRFRVQPS